jgi:hypothetical protein
MKTQQPPLFGRLVWMALPALLLANVALADDRARDGESIYRKQCASCHGAVGEGSDEYPRALAGDKTVAQLARLISKTMPEDDPGTCVGEDADRVASYLHDAFYSKAARERNKPPRIELTRLTVRQYRNAVADLVGTFRPAGSWSDRRGLHGEYFKSRGFRGNGRVIDRIDPEVRFDFGLEGPDPDKFEPDQFSIRWEGSVLAPESGEYEFIVRTEHAARLWVNDTNRALIDAWVKSGNDTEYRSSITLLGGRAYPIRLEFSKARQGVDDKKKDKPKPPPVKASIALAWKLPQRVDEVIPARNLSPVTFPETFVSATAFPPDDRSVGYERGTSVSKAWDQATTDAAIEVATYVGAHLRELSGVGDGSDRAAKLREFAYRFVERAFRRPLGDDQKALYVDRQFASAPDPETAVKRVVLLALKSPRFLYHELDGTPDAHDVAARIAFGLWDSLPDQALLDAAKSGRLATREQVAEQAERMIPDLRTRAKLRGFFFQWLKVEQVPDVSKDPKLFPEFDAAIAADLRTSLDLFLEDVIWGDSSDFRQILLDNALYLNGRLAKLYGADLPADAPFQKVAPDSQERAGVLSHPYMMAMFAYTATTSPIHRGVFITRSVLGRALRPPPEAVAPLAPDLHAGLSTRERVALQTSPASCTTCHAMINPLGFGLERFDAVGRYRNEENGRPIDATGTYETPSGELLPYSGARELAALLADSEETHTAFVEQMFHHLVKQPVRAFGPRTLADLRRSFVSRDFHIRKLMVQIIATSAPYGYHQPDTQSRPVSPAPAPSTEN